LYALSRARVWRTAVSVSAIAALEPQRCG